MTLKKFYWQLTALMLASHFTGCPFGIALTAALTAWQVMHFAIRRRSLRHLEVQVRLLYLACLPVGLLPGGWSVVMVLFVGVNTLLITDYCLAARLLSLAPWNRDWPLTLARVRQVFFTPPKPGSIIDALRDQPGASTKYRTPGLSSS
jgi:hypothetical protein